MVGVLRRLNGSGLLEEYANLSAYVSRGETRPAFKRAFSAQLAVFTGKTQAGNDVLIVLRHELLFLILPDFDAMQQGHRDSALATPTIS